MLWIPNPEYIDPNCSRDYEQAYTPMVSPGHILAVRLYNGTSERVSAAVVIEVETP